MLDPETFLVELYVLADEFGKQHLAPERRPGPAPALDRSEVVTLAIFSQWQQLPSEAAFYRWATTHLRPLFPTLPSRPQFNRLVRHWREAITAFALALGRDLAAPDHAFEIIDSTGVRVRPLRRACPASGASSAIATWPTWASVASSVKPHGRRTMARS